jgi:hypothetical protein
MINLTIQSGLHNRIRTMQALIWPAIAAAWRRPALQYAERWRS